MRERPGSQDYRDPNRYDYHYDRDERMKRLPDDVRAKLTGPSPKGLFRKNRTLTIILLDIVVIVVVWFVFLPLIRTGASGRLEGYSFSLHSFSYGNRALISLKVVNESAGHGLPPSYTAIFGLSSDNESVEMQGPLPEEPHASTTLRTSLPLAAKTVAVVCTVKLANKTLSLKARLQKES